MEDLTDLEQVRVKDHIILTRGEDFMLYRIENNRPRAKFFFTNIDLSNIIGKPFWSVYRMEHVKSKTDNYYRLEYCNPAQVNTNILENVKSGLDNRLIDDDNNAQSLSKQEILDMRSNGESSNEILQKLIKNSKTFSQKTDLAQQKYVKKKSKKYSDFLQVLKPNIRLLAHVLLRGSATAPYMGLRMETLLQIPTCLAFQPDGKYIIYENNCFGLIIASLLDLLSARGKLLNVTTTNYPFNKLKALKAMNFSEEKMARLIYIRSYFFLKYSKFHEYFDSDFCPDTDPDEDNPKRKITVSKEISEKRTKELEKQAEEVRNLSDEKADGLVFVCKETITDQLFMMLQFLAPSRPFVVYCQWREPLVKLFSELKQRNDVIFIRIFENSSRNYQVLPKRTHPYVTTNSSCGFLLTGYTVEPEHESCGK